jgi:hypothetical protein
MRSSSAWSGISSSRRGLSSALDHLGGALVRLRVEEADAVVVQMVHAAKALAHADRPGHWRALDLQHGFDFVEQLDRRPAFAVELVDEGQDRRVAQAADVQQLDGLGFDTVDRIDHHHRRIDGGQGTVGVLGEVFVARRVEQVDHALAVGELHHRAGDRNAALLFKFHPVRGGVAAGLACAHFAGNLDRATEPEQLFGQCRLAGVGVGNDGKGAASGEFLVELGHGGGAGRGEGARLYGVRLGRSSRAEPRRRGWRFGATGFSALESSEMAIACRIRAA